MASDTDFDSRAASAFRVDAVQGSRSQASDPLFLVFLLALGLVQALWVLVLSAGAWWVFTTLAGLL